MNQTFLALLLVITCESNAQTPCPISANLSSSGNCPGATLTVNSPTLNQLSKIIWYNGSTPVSTVNANTTPSIVTIAGGNGEGAAANQLSRVFGVAVDGAGNVYVADMNNNRVQKWAPGATSGVTVAGGNGPGTAANQLNVPQGLFLDAGGNLYIVDNSDRVLKWALGASSGITVAGGNGWGSGANQLENPQQIFVDGIGNIYVADYTNQRIQKWVPGASSGITVAGGNGRGAAANQFSEPSGVYLDANENIYVADQTNNRVQKWAPGATSGITVAGGNGAGSAANQLFSPSSIFIDGTGNMYIDDYANDRIQLWAAGASTGVTVAGGNGWGSAPNQLSFPIFFFLDNSGNIYVSDEYNFRVQEYTTVGTINNSYIAAVAGTYTASITGNAGCSMTTNAEIVGPMLTPALSITTSATSVCQGSSITFTAIPDNGGSAPAYQWQVGGANAGTNSFSFTTSTLTNGSIVACLLTSDATCLSSPTASASSPPITITPPVIPTVTISASATTVCSGSPVTFEATPGNGGTDPIVNWEVNGSAVGAEGLNYTSYSPQNGDIVSCTLTGNAVCNSIPTATSNAVPLTVNPSPSIDTGQVFILQQGQQLTLNPVTSGDPVSYSWTPVTGLSDPAVRNPIADPQSTTVYDLQVVSAYGCKANGDITVKVQALSQLSVPNAFTPNGDGKNDIFYVLGGPPGSRITDFAIFNRWGQRIFQVHDAMPGDPSYGWNGYYQGASAMPGAYVYIINVEMADGTSKVIKGTVMLIR
jgi:gliding motility-associated-like protein